MVMLMPAVAHTHLWGLNNLWSNCHVVTCTKADIGATIVTSSMRAPWQREGSRATLEVERGGGGNQNWIEMKGETQEVAGLNRVRNGNRNRGTGKPEVRHIAPFLSSKLGYWLLPQGALSETTIRSRKEAMHIMNSNILYFHGFTSFGRSLGLL